MPGAAAPVSLPIGTVAAKQLPEVTVVRLHNVPGGINVRGLMASLLQHFQFGPEYSVISEYGGDVSGDIAAVTPAWCRSDVCIAELRAPVQDAKLCQLPDAFTCFGQRVSVSVQPSLLAKAHLYRQRSPRQRRRQQKKARAKKAASQPSSQHQQQLQSLRTTFCLAVSVDEDVESRGRVALTRPLDPVSDLGGQQGRAGLGHSVPKPMLLEPSRPAADQAVASAMLLWAEDIDVPLNTARQSVQHVHAEHIAQITQHGTASHVALAEPLQSLMIEAIRVVTGNASFHPFPDTQAAGSISEP
ncbi:TPA: hypothetical protein ACH3X1_000295 [Trebouxia sp. C0004]